MVSWPQLGIYNKYMISTMALNGCIKAIELCDAPIYYTCPKKKQEMLLTDKMRVVAIATSLGPIRIPCMAINIIDSCEMYIRGTTTEHYHTVDEKKYIYDYIW